MEGYYYKITYRGVPIITDEDTSEKFYARLVWLFLHGCLDKKQCERYAFTLTESGKDLRGKDLRIMVGNGNR